MRTYPGGDTVYCAMLSIKSHTSWSHYSKVFFVKGKRGKRASRFSSAVSGRAPPERPKERQQQEESRWWQREGWKRRARQRGGQQRREQASEKEKENLHNDSKETDTATQTHNFDASQFSGFWTFLNSLAVSCFPKFSRSWNFTKLWILDNSHF